MSVLKYLQESLKKGKYDHIDFVPSILKIEIR